MRRKIAYALASIWLTLLGCIGAQAAPVVSFTTSGSPGDWTYDFSVTNNLGGTNDIYFFGVQLPARDIASSPGGFDPNVWPTWVNSGYGGSSTIYNNNWIASSYSLLPDGTTLSGFEAHDVSASPLTSIQWFLYAFGGIYLGGDNFNSAINPGFEGVTGAVATPLPAALPLFATGLGALGLLGWRRKRKSAPVAAAQG